MKKRSVRFVLLPSSPTPGSGERQKTCGGQACQKALKAANNLRWRKTNPGYYRRDFDRLKDWLADHPGYLKAHRQSHPDYVAKNRIAPKAGGSPEKESGLVTSPVKSSTA